ncbi:19930_t:CDS:1, partial [Dentiscutata erythropus]
MTLQLRQYRKDPAEKSWKDPQITYPSYSTNRCWPPSPKKLYPLFTSK